MEQFDIDQTLQWKFAKIQNVTNEGLDIKLIDENIKGTIQAKTIKWAIRNKKISNVFQVSDVIFVKKNKKKYLGIKTISKS